MSGIFAVCNTTGELDLAAAESRVKDFRLPGSAPHVNECVRRGNVLLGRYHLGIFPLRVMSIDGPSGTLIVPSGYRAGEYPVPFDRERDAAGFGEGTLRFVDRTLREDAVQDFARLDGAFQILHHDERQSRMSIIVDRYGLQPLYVYEDSGVIAAAPEFALLFALIGRTPELDRAALAEFFETGFVSGDRTLFANVQVFPPGSVAVLRDGHLSFQRYWRPVFADAHRGFDFATAAERLDAALRHAVRQRATPASQAAVSLSGGLDSRLLLAAAVKERLPISAYTFGPEGAADQAIAAEVAGKLGVSHQRYVDTPELMVQAMEAGVRKSGGMSNIIDYAGMAHLPEIARRAQVVVNGYGGNELLGFLAFDLLRVSIPRRPAYVAAWLAKKLTQGWSIDEIESFRRSLGADTLPLAERLEGMLAGYPARHPVSRVYHFFFEEKARRANLLGVTSDNRYVEPVVPFYANDVVDFALEIPPRERLFARFYRRFLAEYYPEIAGITYSRTGRPANAPLVRVAMGKISRFGGVRRDPDMPWDHWLRGELREYVQDHLLTGRPRIAEVVAPDLVQRVVAAFMAGQPRRARPIGQLLTGELFLRAFYGIS